MSSTFIKMVKPQEKAYRLRIEYETLDFEDTCPLFNLHVISKPIDDVIHENLHCHAKPLPPPSIAVNSDDFIFEGEFAFPSDFLKKETDNDGFMKPIFCSETAKSSRTHKELWKEKTQG